MLEIERHRAVPILFADFVRRLAMVVGGVVDEHGDRPHALANLLHRRFERGDVGEVALKKERRRCEAPILATRSLDASMAMSTKATLAFCSAKASTIAAPMPDPPPVMKTTLSMSEG